MVSFYTLSDLPDHLLKQIVTLWLETFSKEKVPDNLTDLKIKMGLSDNTVIALEPTKGGRKVIAFLFLFSLTKKIVEEKTPWAKNLLQQGVKPYYDYYLYNLVVREKNRRKGIASDLIKHAEAYAQKNGKRNMILFVGNGNKAAVSLYNKLEYKVLRSISSGFVMRKNLV